MIFTNKLKSSSTKKNIIYNKAKPTMMTKQLDLIMFDLNIDSFLSKFAVHSNAF